MSAAFSFALPAAVRFLHIAARSPAGTRQREVLAQLYNAFPVLKKLLSQLHLIQVFCFASLPELSGGDFLQLFIEMQQ